MTRRIPDGQCSRRSAALRRYFSVKAPIPGTRRPPLPPLQNIIAGFIVDFYCPMLRLAVEVDGPHHASQVEEDLRRTRRLETYGVRVVRVSTQEVIAHLDDVMEVLREALCPQSGSQAIRAMAVPADDAAVLFNHCPAVASEGSNGSRSDGSKAE
jgi:Protein of unknown function (DUF559)